MYAQSSKQAGRRINAWVPLITDILAPTCWRVVKNQNNNNNVSHKIAAVAKKKFKEKIKTVKFELDLHATRRFFYVSVCSVGDLAYKINNVSFYCRTLSLEVIVEWAELESSWKWL